MKRLGKPAFNRLGIQGLPYGFGPMSSKSYTKKVLTPNADVGYDPSSLILYHPMNESAGGVAIDHSPEGNDGAYVGATLGQPGIGDGLNCPLFDGINDLNNAYSAGLDADFNGAEGTLISWGNAFNAGVWTDNLYRALANFGEDTNNYVQIYKSGGAGNPLVGFYAAAGVFDFVQFDVEPANFFNVAITWSAIADQVITYYNGVQQGAIQVGLGVYAGSLSATYAVIGDNRTTNTRPWSGWLAHNMLFTDPLTQPSIEYLSVI